MANDLRSYEHVKARRAGETALPTVGRYAPTGEEIPGVHIGFIGSRGSGWSAVWSTLANELEGDRG